MDYLKDKLLNVLKYFILICEENDLTYYLGAGSVLGAIRHGGIIPWDDDIDIYMPRTDYEKFLQLKYSYTNKDYSIVTLEDKGYYLPFAKIVDMNTTIWERKHFPFIIGIYIDIFPLDRVNLNLKETENLINKYKCKFEKYLRGVSYYSFSDMKKMFLKGDFYRVISSVLKMTVYRKMSRKYLDDFLKFDKSLNNNEGNYWVVFGGSYGIKEIYKREWFCDSIEVDFSGIKVKIPIGYHEYLSYLYGDYMKIPPVEEQQTRHKNYFVDYMRRFTISEIQNKSNNL